MVPSVPSQPTALGKFEPGHDGDARRLLALILRTPRQGGQSVGEVLLRECNEDLIATPLPVSSVTFP